MASKEMLNSCKKTADNITAALLKVENNKDYNDSIREELARLNTEVNRKNNERRNEENDWKNLQGSYQDLTSKYVKNGNIVVGKEFDHDWKCRREEVSHCPSNSNFVRWREDKHHGPGYCAGDFIKKTNRDARRCIWNLTEYDNRRPPAPILAHKTPADLSPPKNYRSETYDGPHTIQCCANIIDVDGTASNIIQNCQHNIEKQLQNLDGNSNGQTKKEKIKQILTDPIVISSVLTLLLFSSTASVGIIL